MKKYLPYLIIFITMILYSLLFVNHYGTIVSDRGREFLIPQEILNGLVPYKDINMIYFPFAFYINAVIYKIFGISVNSLIYTQIFLCILFLFAYYILSKEFLKSKTALILTVLLIPACIFSSKDLFNYIVPYSYSRMYGMFAAFYCIFFLIKLYKSDNTKFAYLAALFAGFSASCKLEFVTVPIILIIGLFLYKKLEIKQYLKLFFTFLIFPVFSLVIMLCQGVSFENLKDLFDYCVKFSQTEVMTDFLSGAGMYPLDLAEKLQSAKYNMQILISLIFTCYMALKLKQMYPKFPTLIMSVIAMFYLFFDRNALMRFWTELPFIVWIIFCINAEKLYKTDKKLLLVIISSILLAQREFFKLCLNFYGTYSLPFLILALVAVVYKFLPKAFLDIKLEKFINYVLVVLILFYTCNTMISRMDTRYTLKSDKGTFYVTHKTSELLNSAIAYIEKNTDKNAKVLVLPEGNIINFITGRKVDMQCFMMDRLYHDAYGEQKARDLIANSNSDYIVLLKGFDLNNFKRPYLYDKGVSLSADYIYDNYSVVDQMTSNKTKYLILKKN